MALTHFTTLIPVAAGREEALQKTLRDLGADERSPFSHLPGTHVTRLYVLDHYGGSLRGLASHRRLRTALLVFSAVVDGAPRLWLERLHLDFEATADEIWSHCAGFPGTADRNTFVGWLLNGEIAPTFPLIAHPDASVETVRTGLDLRKTLGRLAGEVQGAAPGALRAAYRTWFGR